MQFLFLVNRATNTKCRKKGEKKSHQQQLPPLLSTIFLLASLLPPLSSLSSSLSTSVLQWQKEEEEEDAYICEEGGELTPILQPEAEAEASFSPPHLKRKAHAALHRFYDMDDDNDDDDV